MLIPQGNLCLYLQLLVMLQHVNPQGDDTGKSQLPLKSNPGPDATLLINRLCQPSTGLVPIPAGSFVLGTWKEGRQCPDWCSVLEFGWGEHPGFRHRVFSCLCPSQSLIVGLQSNAGISPGSNPDLLHRNELQHETVVKSALAGHCWGSGKQHLLREWPCELICASGGCTIRHILLCGKKWVTFSDIPPSCITQPAQPCLLHKPLVLSQPFITLSKPAPASAFWYQ